MSRPVTLRRACDSCTSRKVRCDGGTPCASCERRGHSCCYSERRKCGPRPKAQLDLIDDALPPRKHRRISKPSPKLLEAEGATAAALPTSSGRSARSNKPSKASSIKRRRGQAQQQRASQSTELGRTKLLQQQPSAQEQAILRAVLLDAFFSRFAIVYSCVSRVALETAVTIADNSPADHSKCSNEQIIAKALVQITLALGALVCDREDGETLSQTFAKSAQELSGLVFDVPTINSAATFVLQAVWHSITSEPNLALSSRYLTIAKAMLPSLTGPESVIVEATFSLVSHEIKGTPFVREGLSGSATQQLAFELVDIADALQVSRDADVHAFRSSTDITTCHLLDHQLQSLEDRIALATDVSSVSVIHVWHSGLRAVTRFLLGDSSGAAAYSAKVSELGWHQPFLLRFRLTAFVGRAVGIIDLSSNPNQTSIRSSIMLQRCSFRVNTFTEQRHTLSPPPPAPKTGGIAVKPAGASSGARQTAAAWQWMEQDPVVPVSPPLASSDDEDVAPSDSDLCDVESPLVQPSSCVVDVNSLFADVLSYEQQHTVINTPEDAMMGVALEWDLRDEQASRSADFEFDLSVFADL